MIGLLNMKMEDSHTKEIDKKYNRGLSYTKLILQTKPKGYIPFGFYCLLRTYKIQFRVGNC